MRNVGFHLLFSFFKSLLLFYPPFSIFFFLSTGSFFLEKRKKVLREKFNPLSFHLLFCYATDSFYQLTQIGSIRIGPGVISLGFDFCAGQGTTTPTGSSVIYQASVGDASIISCAISSARQPGPMGAHA